MLIAKTVAAVRVITVERGFDPRDFAMLSYGGAGSMFVTAVAREMAIPEVIVPQGPSVFSAWGMLMSDVVQSYTQTLIGLLDDIGLPAIREGAARMSETARTDLARGGFTAADQTIEAAVELRYFGQEHALEVPMQEGDDLDAIRKRFDEIYRNRYGHAMGDPVQLVNLRVRGIGRNDKPKMATIVRGTGKPAPRRQRDAYCFAKRIVTRFAVHHRDDLGDGDTVPGPAIIEERTTTIVLHSDQAAHVDGHGIIFIRRQEA